MMKKGFTLAEILITLSIVGVVAVLSIPSVMKNYKNRMYTAQLQKVYSQIAGAAEAIMSDEQVDDFKETKASAANSKDTDNEYIAGPAYFLNNYFKTIKQDCASSSPDSDSNACVSKNAGYYKTITGSSVSETTPDYCVQTVNGAAICSSYNSSNQCLSILVDVNGLESPNIAGRDIFSMDIHSSGSISDYYSGCGESSYVCASSSCTKGSTSNLYNAACGCLTSVIESGWKMEY